MTLSTTPPAAPPAPPPAAASRRRCRACAGWDGDDADIGLCVIRDRWVSRVAVACPDFHRMPNVRMH